MFQRGCIPGIPTNFHERYEHDAENFVFWMDDWETFDWWISGILNSDLGKEPETGEGNAENKGEGNYILYHSMLSDLNPYLH